MQRNRVPRIHAYGENGLNFKLYVFHDLNKDVGTDLRMAILDAFHEAGFRKLTYLSNG
jgi:hypothetical protein